ncbi:hypothetical protein LTR99_003571 [Exophiala xenobiotica]|uniref:Gag1-like clamp domain-containing protein n=1 Tax=Vermiconidia calcicola TaxID=1690605 RepID=A0AAV9Q1N4_9PEZI|nr:hypothetical protein LTR96_010281 [Exophiala xenobiotica]KAK5529639.1 hypothetical protein LTR23_010610 [Chaetothyriales sp. CCFEE 6169]KAK5531266.1 hypothetical protein LTR25_008373 [Vermiconidia calcicola]KAK5304508.1 hypothetical protein LTR99_003571 [Exophiala xenobiotica]KAK5369338.1 hypothetical protein LTS13_007059 [Exophiala xenobiotica]
MHPSKAPDSSPTRSSLVQSSRPQSVDSHHNSSPHHTPLLHNLTQRLRKGSNTSSSNSSADGTAHPAQVGPASGSDPVKKTENSRATRRVLLGMVRDDWEYPSTAVKDNTGLGLPHREPLGYKLREESLSDIEADEAREKATAAKKRASHAHAHAHERGKMTDPYRFETPDAVGHVIAERKRKRRKLVAEEMSYNDGLRVWMNRRDAWTGAVRRRPKDSAMSARSSLVAKRDRGTGDGHEQDGGGRQRPSHFFRRSSSMLAHGLGPGHVRDKSGSSAVAGDNASPTDTGPTSSPTRSHASPVAGSSIDSSIESPSANTNTNTNKDKDGDKGMDREKDEGEGEGENNEGPWLPIFPPLLPPDDSLRDRINAKAYATIYSKIVVQGLAPNVPIPLVHMIPALVAGWKAEGNWPPQPASIAAADVKKGRKSSAFAKWHKEHAHDSKAVDGQVALHEREDGKSRVRRSISMMKRVLGGGGDEGERGLEELGIEFREQDEEEMEKNVTLNRGLVEH